jgi:hypothetical protein
MNAREALARQNWSRESVWSFDETPRDQLRDAYRASDEDLAALSDAGYLVVRITPKKRQQMVDAIAVHIGADFGPAAVDPIAAAALASALAVLTAEGEA